MPLQWNSGIPVQVDWRNGKLAVMDQSGPLRWLFPLCTGLRNIGKRTEIMISGGNATVFVSNMDRAVEFYTDVLGLKLTNRFGDNWATVEAGKGLTIGLHPASPKYPVPGTKGAMMLGLEIDEAIHIVVDRLKEKGVKINGVIVRDESGNFAHFEDPDGNEIYIWEVNPKAVAESGLAYAVTRD
ncbi:MAG TPA: VOC family protein [Bryobacteraceae bacterium]|nr:VOC family protein [Bryobacteraceae bacterium]